MGRIMANIVDEKFGVLLLRQKKRLLAADGGRERGGSNAAISVSF
jgi:hypothetical protein